MKRKKRLEKNVLVFSVLTFLTALAMVAFAIYKAAVKTEYIDISKEVLRPLDSKLNLEILDKIEQRKEF